MTAKTFRVAGEMALIRIRGRGQLTLPDEVRRSVRLKEGDYLEVSVQGGEIRLRPQAVVDADQAWFWADTWQAGERAASADIRAGRVSEYSSDQEFLDSLE